MDNKKIGKLIADLRKMKGLTQQELGDKVGVGYRAVSKWERGITLPDISIINEVSKILGISSDELLAGEIKKEIKDKKKTSPKLKITLFTIIILIIISAVTLSSYNNKTYTYNIDSIDEEYYIEGQVIINNKDIKIIINKLNFQDQELLDTEIKNHEYQIYSGNQLLVGYGDTEVVNQTHKIDTIKQFIETFRINYNGKLYIKKGEILKNGLSIHISFENTNKQIIEKEIKTKLTKSENNK